MLSATPPPETAQEITQKYLKPEVVQEQRLPEQELEKVTKRKETLLRFGGCFDISGGLEPGRGIKHDAQLAAGLSAGKLFSLETWNESGVFGNLYSETQLYVGSGLPIHPVGELDASIGEKAVFRGGVATDWMTFPSLKRLKLKAEFYPVSNVKDNEGNKEMYLWIKGKYLLPKDWAIGGMTKQFSSRNENGRNQVYHLYVERGLKRGWYAKASYWRIPHKKERYQMGFGKRF